MLDKQLEDKVDKEIKEELEKCFISEDMFGYKNVFDNLKVKKLKKDYNIDYYIKKDEGCKYD